MTEMLEAINNPKIKIGKIEVTNMPQILDCGKNNKINQNGITPIFNHK